MFTGQKTRIADRLDAWLPGVQAAAARADAELELVATILSDPARAMPILDAAGVVAAHFDQPDLQLIFAAADVARTKEKGSILVLARRALRAEGLWDPTQIAGNWRVSMRWSDASLCRLACSAYFNPSHVRHRAQQLKALIGKMHDAGQYIRAARKLIEECLGPGMLRLQVAKAAREDAA